MRRRPLRGGPKPSNPPNLSLAQRLAAGDEAALLEIWSSQAPALLGVAGQIIPDMRAAEEVVGDAFVRLWREAAGWPAGITAPQFWLVLEVRRLALQQGKVSPSRSDGDEMPGEIPLGVGAWMPKGEDIALLASRRVLLKKVLRQLPRHQQDALSLAVWEGLSEPEIAARLGEPLARVQSSLRAGMRFIRHRMNVVLGKWSAPI